MYNVTFLFFHAPAVETRQLSAMAEPACTTRKEEGGKVDRDAFAHTVLGFKKRADLAAKE